MKFCCNRSHLRVCVRAIGEQHGREVHLGIAVAITPHTPIDASNPTRNPSNQALAQAVIASPFISSAPANYWGTAATGISTTATAEQFHISSTSSHHLDLLRSPHPARKRRCHQLH